MKNKRWSKRIHLGPIFGKRFVSLLHLVALLLFQFCSTSAKKTERQIQKRYIHWNLCFLRFMSLVFVCWIVFSSVSCRLLIAHIMSWGRYMKFENKFKSKKESVNARNYGENLRIKYIGITVKWCGWTKCAHYSLSLTLFRYFCHTRLSNFIFNSQLILICGECVFVSPVVLWMNIMWFMKQYGLENQMYKAYTYACCNRDQFNFWFCYFFFSLEQRLCIAVGCMIVLCLLSFISWNEKKKKKKAEKTGSRTLNCLCWRNICGNSSFDELITASKCCYHSRFPLLLLLI